MRQTLVVAFLFLAALTVPLFSSIAQKAETDFISEISAVPEAAESIGLPKLNATERVALNTLLNLVYRTGYEAGLEATPPKPSPVQKAAPPRPSRAATAKAYKSRIESGEGEILKLTNGAIVEISTGYLGYVGFGRDAVLFNVGAGWRVWVEGKRAYSCNLLKEPGFGAASSAELVYVSEVKGDGSILVLDNGSILEVDALNTIDTMLWLGLFEAVLLDGTELINLDEGDAIVSVIRLR